MVEEVDKKDTEAVLSIEDDLKPEDAKQDDTSDCDSELAENLVQKTYVEKKADRLIKEFQTESDDEAEIEEVKSAVKQQIEIEERKLTGDLAADLLEEEKVEPVSVEKDQTAQPQKPAETPQAADKLTGSSARESQNSSS